MTKRNEEVFSSPSPWSPYDFDRRIRFAPGTELHDLKRSHYSGVWNLAEEIAASPAAPRNDQRKGARNDTGGGVPFITPSPAIAVRRAGLALLIPSASSGQALRLWSGQALTRGPARHEAKASYYIDPHVWNSVKTTYDSSESGEARIEAGSSQLTQRLRLSNGLSHRHS